MNAKLREKILDLVGWKEISVCLNDGSPDTTVRKYQRSLKFDDPMPVFNDGRAKANSSELLDWQRRQKPKSKNQEE